MFLREELPKLLEDVPLQRRVNMLIQQDGSTPHYGEGLPKPKLS